MKSSEIVLREVPGVFHHKWERKALGCLDSNGGVAKRIGVWDWKILDESGQDCYGDGLRLVR